jgi:hypothetical protein
MSEDVHGDLEADEEQHKPDMHEESLSQHEPHSETHSAEYTQSHCSVTHSKTHEEAEYTATQCPIQRRAHTR